MSAPILVLAPLRDGEADAARAAIAALDEPFARVPGTHLARLQVLRPPPRRFRGRTRHYVLLAADHDGPVEPWLAAAARELAPALGPLRLLARGRRPGRGRALGAGARAAGRLLGRRLAARERRGGGRRARAARARRGARRADDGPRRRGAAGRLEGLVIDVADLQGGIVRGYGQRFGFARHLFARVREPRAARAFLAALADPVTTEEEWAGHPETTLNVALSHRALAALELPAWILDGFPRRGPRRHGGARRPPRRRPGHVGATTCATSRSSSSCTRRAPRRSRPRRRAGSASCAPQDSGLELGPRAAGRAARRAARALRLHRRLLAAGDRGRRPRGRPRPGDPVQARAVVAAEPHAMARGQAGRVRPGLRGRGPRPRARAARALRPQRQLHGVAQAAPGRRRLPRPARRAGPAAGARRGARRGQARRALARRQPAGPAPRRPRPRRSATTSGAPTTSATATTSSGLRCPRGAHVRRTNPRDTLGWEGRLTARHRILRRGMPYGPALPEGAAGRRRGRAGCSSSACRPRSRASSRSSSRSGATTATPSAWAARPTPSPGPAGGEVRHIIEGDPPHVVVAAAQLRRVPRRRVPRRSGRQRAAGAARALTPPVTRRAGARRIHTQARLERVGTPFHAKSRPRVRPTLGEPTAMTSREHARRLMLILLTSEGTALRKAADDRTMRRERLVGGGDGIRGTGRHGGLRGGTRARCGGVAVVGRAPPARGRATRAVGV